jgi:nicotinamide-nucleotide amidase
MMFGDELLTRAERLLSRCRAHKLLLATAESCTGGLVIGLLTEIAGSSDVVDRGFVTYSNSAKQQLLGVPLALLERFGAVSEEVALAMAEGALDRAKVDLTVAVTGVAGPGGGSATKPVGLVHFAAAAKGRTTLRLRREFGEIGREQVRLRSVETALELLERQIGD